MQPVGTVVGDRDEAGYHDEEEGNKTIESEEALDKCEFAHMEEFHNETANKEEEQAAEIRMVAGCRRICFNNAIVGILNDIFH